MHSVQFGRDSYLPFGWAETKAIQSFDVIVANGEKVNSRKIEACQSPNMDG